MDRKGRELEPVSQYMYAMQYDSLFVWELKPLVGFIWTRDAPCAKMSGLWSLFLGMSKHSNRSDLVQLRRPPFYKRDGGKGWFSC